MAKGRNKQIGVGIGSGAAPIYQIKITLKGIRPPIWRRVLVPGGVSLAALHDIIQVAMGGWVDYHLHEFDVGDIRYGVPSPEDWEPVNDERKVTLRQVAPAEGAKFAYIYDFGDWWEHTIVVEKRLSAAPDVRYPVCIKGKRACPPEDCGGPWGYADLSDIIQNPHHEEYASMMEWLGGEFAPEAFDLEVVNRALGRIQRNLA